MRPVTNVLKKVKSVFKELKVTIPDAAIDRAHRIGKPKVKNGINTHTMIIRFTTWRHRTEVYRARKASSKYKIRLDLTKKRLNAMVKVLNDLDTKELGFAFADVNCWLCAKVGDKFVYFNANDDLDAFVARFESEDDGDDGDDDESKPSGDSRKAVYSIAAKSLDRAICIHFSYDRLDTGIQYSIIMTFSTFLAQLRELKLGICYDIQ